jgi:hypothetical protein
MNPFRALPAPLDPVKSLTRVFAGFALAEIALLVLIVLR